jgi:hypothetical protein
VSHPNGDPAGNDRERELRAAAADFRGALARLDAELAGLHVPADAGRSATRRSAATSPVDASCKALLAVVRKRCPGLLPADDLRPGDVASPVPIPADSASSLFVTALRQSVATAVTGRVPPPDAELPTTVLWEEGADALLALVGSTKMEIGDGEVTVSLPVRCDQLARGSGVVTVRLVVGTPERPAGLFAATSTVPQGPPVVVRRWADALTALVWTALLEVVRGVARGSGRDIDGTGLVPVALVASPQGLVVLPQARHAIDRVASA